MNAQNIFFQLPNLKKDIVRGRSGYCVPGENKTKAMDHLRLFQLNDLSHSMP